MKKIILASASPRREELLKQIGFEFTVQASCGEELPLQAKPEDMVKELSYQKAREIFDNGNRAAIVIGADTVVYLEDRILGKPKSAEECREMLKLLQGRKHYVFTGVTVMWTGEDENPHLLSFVTETKVYLSEITEEEIEAYIASGEPFDKAGGYAIQGLFAKFVDRIDGDYNNVVGLPVSRLYQELRKLDLV